MLKFSTEYLFPRFKFLEKGWIVHKPEDGEDGMCFSIYVKNHLPLPDDVVFEEKWDTLIAPTIVKRYTDMRCNVNGMPLRFESVFCPKYFLSNKIFFYLCVCQSTRSKLFELEILI